MNCTAELIDKNGNRLTVENAEFLNPEMDTITHPDGTFSRNEKKSSRVIIPQDSMQAIRGFNPVHIIIKMKSAQEKLWNVSYQFTGPPDEFRLTM